MPCSKYGSRRCRARVWFAEGRREDGRPSAPRSAFHRRRRAGGTRLAFLAGLLLFPSVSTGRAQTPTESQVKAAYIFNFFKFVEWPDDPPGDARIKWVVGFVGDGPVSEEFVRLFDGKQVLGHDLQAKKVLDADGMRACNILFINSSEKKRVGPILASLHGSSVLTVSDIDDFTGSGGMIQLFIEETRVRMTIDVTLTSRARLRISSKMLSLAHVVGSADRGPNN